MMGEPPITVSVAPADLAQAAAVSNVARALDAPEIIEYWKSAPYLLNFMRHYSLKRLLEAQIGRAFRRDPRRIAAARPAMLDRTALDAYAALEPANGRMRADYGRHIRRRPRTESLDPGGDALLRAKRSGLL